MSQSTRSSKRASRSSFIERTLVDINVTLEQSLFADQIARQNGFLQTLDPRLKVILTILLLIAVSLSHSLIILVGLYFLALGLAAISSVPLGFFIKRVWVFIPFFTGLVALPALFITPGAVLARLPFGLVITQTGLLTALFLLLRVGTSVSFSVLLVLTTAWNDVLKALGVLGVPDVLTLILGITYRYIHLLLHLANELFLVRKSRILKRETGSEERRLLAATSGTLLGKSLQISSEVYLSMVSRGFRNYPRTIDVFQMKLRDWISSAAVLIIIGTAIWLGR
ncbi:MAG: cobalt ECF transporter T component CbiQ [Anaerolineaceae bacterium]|nr:cobalt ECF transporter T component CbiQ [Anaerolineaceae bacterium]